MQMATSDKCLGLVEELGDVFPETDWQRCTVHWYRNILKDVPKSKMRPVAAMLKAIHAQKDRAAADENVLSVVEKLKSMKMGQASEHVQESAAETPVALFSAPAATDLCYLRYSKARGTIFYSHPITLNNAVSGDLKL